MACIAIGTGMASGLILGLFLVCLDHRFRFELERITEVDKGKAWAVFGIGARVVRMFRKAASLSYKSLAWAVFYVGIISCTLNHGILRESEVQLIVHVLRGAMMLEKRI